MDTSSIQPGELDQAGKHSYPIVLLRVIKRQAEDLLWKGEVTQGRAALEFLKWVTGENTDPDAAAITKVRVIERSSLRTHFLLQKVHSVRKIEALSYSSLGLAHYCPCYGHCLLFL